MDIRLDKDAMKALANEKRVEMLKLLGARRHMQSEIASACDLAVPTVKEHLAALEKAGLIERFDEGRKWKYYGITKKGKGILEPEQTRIWIVLAVFIFSIIGAIRTWFMLAETAVQGSVQEVMQIAPQQMMKAAPLAANPVPQAIGVAQSQSAPWLYIFIMLAAVSGVLVFYLVARQKAYQEQLGKSLTKKERINKRKN